MVHRGRTDPRRAGAADHFALPLPESTLPAGGLRVYFSFGHVQMMLEPMPKLSREVWMYFFPAGKGNPTRQPRKKSPT